MGCHVGAGCVAARLWCWLLLTTWCAPPPASGFQLWQSSVLQKDGPNRRPRHQSGTARRVAADQHTPPSAGHNRHLPTRLAAVSAESASSEEDVVGVDIWGEPVTAADMRPAASPEGDRVEDDAAAAVSPAAPESEPEPPTRRYTEADLAGSEWKIGVLWRDATKIEVTWFRCKEDMSAEWGYGFGLGSEGTWRLEDGAFLTVTRDYPLGWHGRRLYSARLGDDENYVEGIIRGWKPWEPASVMGQFQAIRLGVDRPNPAPWMIDDDDDDDDEAAATPGAIASTDADDDDDKAAALAGSADDAPVVDAASQTTKEAAPEQPAQPSA